jgi:hypothetical protein
MADANGCGCHRTVRLSRPMQGAQAPSDSVEHGEERLPGVACEPWPGSVCIRKGAKFWPPEEQCALGLHRMAGDRAEPCHVRKQPKRVQAVDRDVVDALAQHHRHQGRRARIMKEAGKVQLCAVGRCSESLLSNSPRDALAND